MSVNESIYGAKENWIKAGSMTQTDPNMIFYLAYFGENQSSLLDGVNAGKLSFTTAIDKSLSWCGLGNFSTYSNVEYWNAVYGEYTQDPPCKFELYRKEQRMVSNFLWSFDSNISPALGICKYSRTTSTIADYAAYNRWTPNAGFFNNQANGNQNSNIKPIVSIPIKNCVLVPYVAVRSDITTHGQSGVEQNLYYWDYIDLNNAINYTTHPYITAIGAKVYTYVAADSQSRSVYLGTNTCGVHIIDELSYQDGQPKYMDNQSVKMGMIYSYVANSFGSNVVPRKIFGTGTTLNGNMSNTNDYHIGTVNAIASGNTGITNRSQIIQVLPHPDAVWSDPVDTSYRIYYLTWTPDLTEWIRRQIACFGLFFTDDEQTAESGELDDEKMFLGILKDGVGNGDYSSGADNKKQDQWNWNTTNDSGYDPYNPPEIDPNAYDGRMRTHDLVLTDTATQRYALTPTGVYGLLDKLWDIMALADPDEALTDFSVGEFLATNPIDAIVSLQFLPVSGINTGTATTVKLGTHDTQVACQTGKTSLRVDCGNYKIFPRFGNSWIDRMTKITLYLPFCGTVNLDPEVYINRSVNVEYLIDLTTGTCTAVVSFIGDGGQRVITDTASGSCGMDLPVTGIQQQTLNSQLFNASEQTKQLKVNNAFKGFNSIMNGVSAMNNSNPASSISGLLGAGQDIYNIFQSEKIADYNLQHTMIPTKMIGTSGGLTGAMCEWYPVIIFERPSLPEGFDYFGSSADYAHTEGYACCISGSLQNFSGYTECINVDLSGFEATTTEKNMIRAALSGGVYL